MASYQGRIGKGFLSPSLRKVIDDVENGNIGGGNGGTTIHVSEEEPTNIGVGEMWMEVLGDQQLPTYGGGGTSYMMGSAVFGDDEPINKEEGMIWLDPIDDEE